jgi:hypothetical protein
MWPPEVEQVAAFFRAAGAEARLEELPRGEDDFPGVGVRVAAYDCGRRRVVVALVPSDRAADPAKLGCAAWSPVLPPAFPFCGADVYFERALLGERTVWIQAGSRRHVAGLSPVQLARLLHAQTRDVVADA